MADLPHFQKFNGTDYFLLFQDRLAKRYGISGNLCRMLIEVSGNIDQDIVGRRLEAEPILRWLSSLVFEQKMIFRRPRWRRSMSYQPKFVFTHEVSEDRSDFQFYLELCERDLQGACSSPISFHIVKNVGGGGVIVFAWHHSLLDSHGAEGLIKALVLGEPVTKKLCFGGEDPSVRLSLLERLESARKVKNFLKKKMQYPLVALSSTAQIPGGATLYDVKEFSVEETVRIDRQCQFLGAKFRKSAFFMVCIAKSLSQVLEARGENIEHKSFLIPVPQDRRKRGTPGPLISNHVGFMFYSLPAAELANLSGAIQCINQQMVDQIKDDMGSEYVALMDSFTHLPLPIYQKIISSPSRGVLASFNFSDVGESWAGINDFWGNPISSLTHFPPNSFPPGFTCIFMRRSERLKMVTASLPSVFSAAEHASFLEHMTQTLMCASQVDYGAH